VTQPETGTVTYTYDALSRTSTKTCAKNQKVQYIYDSHSRVSEVRRYPASSGAEDATQRTTFYWDYATARYGAGRVGLIQYGNGFQELFHYKRSGLVEEKGLYAPGAAAWLSAVYTYNNEGQRTSLKYPDVYDSLGQIVTTGRTINSTYDSMGRLATIRDPGLGGGTDMVSGAQYNVAGQLTQMSVAWEGTRTFNYNTLGQLTRQTSPGVDLEYIFPSTDNDGRLWKKKDWLSGEEVTYQYDEIGRLTAAATTGPEWGLSWTYDGFGNRLAQTVTKGSAPAASVTVNPATNRVVGLGYL
jgi:YD repeat-containing protein